LAIDVTVEIKKKKTSIHYYIIYPKYLGGSIMKNFKNSIIIVLACLQSMFVYGVDQNYYISDVQQSQIRWTGVAVSPDHRFFVSFPRENNIPFSVGEIVEGNIIPYPNSEWNNWNLNLPAQEHFVCVFKVCIWIR